MDTRENESFTWNEASGSSPGSCGKLFDDVTKYFLEDGVTQVGETVTVPGSEPATANHCCVASEATDVNLREDCHATSVEASSSFTWNEGDMECMKNFDSIVTYRLPSD